MTPQALRDHVRILGWCFIVYSVIFVVIGVGIGALVLTGGALSGDREAMLITGAVGTMVAGILTLVSLPGILIGWGLLRFRPWARILGIIFGVLHLLSIPFGTAMGIYAMFVLLNDDARTLFEGSPALISAA